MCEGSSIDPLCEKQSHQCPALHAWSLAVPAGCWIDVSPTARSVGFIVPVALSARLWAKLQKIPPGAAWRPFEKSLEALLTQAYQIIYHSQCPRPWFSFRMPWPGPQPRFLSMFITSQVEWYRNNPLALFCQGEPPWLSLPGPTCSQCRFPREAFQYHAQPLKEAIVLNPLPGGDL